MLILTIRTDKPDAKIGLYEDSRLIVDFVWRAHFELAEKLHGQIRDLLTKTGNSWHDIQGLVVFEGPGSFTGLRIGITLANTLADTLKVPIVGGRGSKWAVDGIKELLEGTNQFLVMPEYGADVHITTSKK